VLVRAGGSEIYVVRVGTAALSELTSGHGSSGPSWSPDGSRIAFEWYSESKSEVDPDGFLDPHTEIYVMNADGSRRRKLTHTGGDAGRPVSSPTPHS
jgi:Tol biopolymer transport system component